GRDLPAGSAARAADLAGTLGVRSESAGLAAYAVLVARYTRQSDLLLGMPLRAALPDGAPAPVGSYGTLVPLRIDLSGEPTFADAVTRADRALRAALDGARVPFELILDAAGASGDMARLSLVRLGFATATRRPERRTAAGLELSVERLPTGLAGFEALLTVDPDAGRADVEYATALFDQHTVERLAERFGRILAAGAAAPDTRHTRLPLISDEERRQVVVDWNRTDRRQEPELVHDPVAAQAAARPDATALADADGETTYGELAERAGRLANHLRDAGVGPEERVVLLLERARRMIPAVLGVLQAGGAYVPVDPSLPEERVTTMLEDCAPGVVLTDAGLRARVPAGPWRVVDLDAEADAIAARPSTAPETGVRPENAAYVIYTSGSTGRPKGVVVEHRNVTNFVRTVQREFEVGPEDRITQFFSLGFDVSVFEIFTALSSGARLYVVNDEERLSLDALGRVLEGQEISVADLPPALLELLDPQRVPALRVAFVGLEAFPGELATRWSAGGRRFYNGYGPTETTVAVVAKRCEGVWDGSPPIGRPMDNHRAYVLDAELEPQGAGVPGELAIAGAGVGRGYLGQPAQTADRFRPDPFGPPGSRLYLTGDLAKWLPGGDLLFLGRVDRQVKVRGVRIELGEIEAALTEHEGVAQAVVEAISDPRGSTVLTAYVVGAGGVEQPPEALREHLVRKLPPPMVPTLFLPLERIPLTASGKVDVRALPTVDFASLAGSGDDSDLRSPTERKVAEQVFAPLLGVPRVGLHDHFFAIGGTSLQAFKIVPRIQEVFGVKLPLADFFQRPTVAEVAATVERLRADAAAGPEDDLLAALSAVEGRSEEEVEEMLRAPSGPEDRR
ncbi:MAG TPA: amino acid adenylation domain-containing protein, partial [Candidatus Dormibacteraeota bacterium]